MSNRKEYRKNVIEFKHDISGKLRKMRLERELSIEELSDNINIAPMAIKGFGNRKPERFRPSVSSGNILQQKNKVGILLERYD